MIILKDLPVRDKEYLRTVRLPGRVDIRFLRDDRLTIFHPLTLSVTVAGYQEITTQGIHRLDTHTIQTHGFLKRLAIVFSAGIHLARHIHDLTQRDTTAIIPHGYRTFLDSHLDTFAVPHHVLVDRVIQHLLQQHIDTIIGIATVPQFSDIHTGTPADMLHPVQCLDVIIVIFRRLLYR